MNTEDMVECYDEQGAQVYQMIIRQILQDVQIYRAIQDLRVFVDPREPVFIIVIKYLQAAPPVHVEDFTEYSYDEETKELFIRIKDEKYLPELLERLWELEGRSKIHQPSRFEVIVDDPQHDIKGLLVHNPEEDLKKKLYDAIFRIIPEGFRVVEHYSEQNLIAMTCSDEIIKEEWINKTHEMIDDIKKEKRLY